jgi:nucleotidyltransferase substrate binding protein (TIGR01987 family)
MRDACIQRFEYTYELAHKMLRRQLEQMAGGSDEVDQMTFPTLIRTGAEKGLLRSSWDVWKMHRDARNCSTNIDMAEMVFNQISSFYREAKFLVSQLRSIN